MRTVVLIVLAIFCCTAKAATTCATSASSGACAGTSQCTNTAVTFTASGTAGTCNSACSHATTSSNICYDSSTAVSAATALGNYWYCTSGACVTAPTTCTTNAGCTTATEVVNVNCAYTGVSTNKGCLRGCVAGAGANAYGRCYDPLANFCPTNGGSCTAKTCAVPSDCSADSSNAQCVASSSAVLAASSANTYTCQAACAHGTGQYCHDTTSSTPSIYCNSGVCGSSVTGGGLTATASIPTNCAVGTSTTVCTACKQGYGTQTNGSAVSCVACNAACLDCYKGADNTSCVSYKYPLDGVYRSDITVGNCSSGYVAGAAASGVYTCYNCSTNCTNCQSPNTASPPTANTPAICQSCASGSYLNGSVTVLNSTSSSNVVVGYNCIGCPANCTSCTNSSYCVKCNGSLTWNNSTKKCFGTKMAASVIGVSLILLTIFSF